MSRDQKEICLNCRWWVYKEDNWGVCRLRAPIVALGQIEYRTDDFKVCCKPIWPPTDDDFFCGDFKSRPDDGYERFMVALEDSSPPSPELKAALTEPAPWDDIASNAVRDRI